MSTPQPSRDTFVVSFMVKHARQIRERAEKEFLTPEQWVARAALRDLTKKRSDNDSDREEGAEEESAPKPREEKRTRLFDL